MLCVCLCVWFMAYVWSSENNLMELLSSVHLWILVIKLSLQNWQYHLCAWLHGPEILVIKDYYVQISNALGYSIVAEMPS